MLFVALFFSQVISMAENTTKPNLMKLVGEVDQRPLKNHLHLWMWNEIYFILCLTKYKRSMKENTEESRNE